MGKVKVINSSTIAFLPEMDRINVSSSSNIIAHVPVSTFRLTRISHIMLAKYNAICLPTCVVGSALAI